MTKYAIFDFWREYDPNPPPAPLDLTPAYFCRECCRLMRERRDHCPDCVDHLDRLWRFFGWV